MEVLENEPFSVSAEDGEQLQKLLGGYLQRQPDGYVVRRVVGHIKLRSGNVLRIRSPKSSAASILTWAAYCDPALASMKLLGVIDDAADVGDLAGITARLFALELIRAATRNGLVRNYERRLETVSVVRGRIDFSRVARCGGQLAPTPCITWARTLNTPINRFLNAVVDAIEADDIMAAASRRELPHLQAILDGVPRHVDREILSANVPLPRNQQHLEACCALGRLIVQAARLDDGTGTLGAAFLLNIENLFERTVAQAFREASIASIPKYPATFEEAIGSNTASRSMQLDLLLPSTKIGPIVIDAKYKTSISSSNLQQVVTYCFLLGARRAFLVVPAGHVTCAAYKFESKVAASDISIDVVELATDARSVDGWRASATRMVTEILVRIAN